VIKAGADARLKKIFAGIGIPERRPFQPDAFQVEALEKLKASDCLVTAPTGSGKTWIAEQAIRRFLESGGRAWYASPLKALSNAKYADFGRIFGPRNVGILTGDRKENPDAAVIVGTTEILRNQLYDAMHTGRSLATELVILDEAHFLGDPERGVVWEEVMIYLPARIPLLLLSATIGNARQIAAWLASIRSRKCEVVEETRRPVPLFPLLFHPSGTLLALMAPASAKGRNRIDKKVLNYLNSPRPRYPAPPGRLPPFGDILAVLRRFRLLPAIFFLKSRADCDRALERCEKNRILDPERRERLSRRVSKLLAPHPHIRGHHQREALENLAVGAHHSGQLPAWKLVLETLMTEGLLDAVFATTTVAAGVNFPARTVAFLNSDRFNGREFLPLDPTEFHQMTGRAGRRGMDRIGFALVVPGRYMDVRLVAKLVSAPPSEVLSQIRINFSMVLNLLLSHSPEEVDALLDRSFASYLISHRRQRKHQPAAEDLRRALATAFRRHLEFLKHRRFVHPEGALTEDGRWASQLRVDQPLAIAEGIRRDLFPADDPARLAGIIAAFVNEREYEVDAKGVKRIVPRDLMADFKRVARQLRGFFEDLRAGGFEVRPLYFRPAVTVWAWAAGHPWQEVCRLGEIEEGDMTMLALRTADNLRHVRSLAAYFPALAQTAGEAVDLILREPVTAEILV
jgi:superfamily II RNA helicase